MRKTAIFALSSILVGCAETFDSIYEDYDEVKMKGAIDRGWFPEWFPLTAYDIKESHNIDTNETSIGWKNKGRWNIPNACARISPNDAPPPGLKRSWWPADVPANELSTQKYIFFDCGDSAYLAVEPNRSKAYYWRLSR